MVWHRLLSYSGGMRHSSYIYAADLTSDQTQQIRAWRVDEEMSWRAIAQAASDTWGMPYGSNQLFGEDLCRAAAEALGEDFTKEPWN